MQRPETVVHIVRHGQNPANLTREFSYRQVDYSLNDLGRRQARATAAHLSTRPISAVYTSPLKRARETAEPIAAEHGLPVHVVEEFREVNVGTLEGVPPSDAIWAVHDDIFARWLRDEDEATFPGGEDRRTLLARMTAGLRRVAEETGEGEAVVAAHGGILFATIGAFCPELRLSTEGDWHIPNCAITTLGVRHVSAGAGVAVRLVAWAACDHLAHVDVATPVAARASGGEADA